MALYYAGLNNFLDLGFFIREMSEWGWVNFLI